MELGNFTDTLATQLNNPDCSLLAGSFMGKGLDDLISLKYFLTIVLFFAVIKFVMRGVSDLYDYVKRRVKN